MEVKYIDKNGNEKTYKYDTKEYSKRNRLVNADKIKLKHTCDCGGSYSMTNKHLHFKTKKHINYINNTEKNIIDNIIKDDQN